MADRTEVFTIDDGETTSNAIVLDNDGLFGLKVESDFDGTAITIQAAIAYGDTPTDLKMADQGSATLVTQTFSCAAGDVIWFPLPIAGVYSLRIVSDTAQTDEGNITPRWGRLIA